MVVQSAYLWQAENAPAVRFSAVTFGDSVRVGRTLMAALGVPEPAINLVPLTPEAFRARVTQLYRQMRDAMARGDFAAFGEAYASLGLLLQATPAVP